MPMTSRQNPRINVKLVRVPFDGCLVSLDRSNPLRAAPVPAARVAAAARRGEIASRLLRHDVGYGEFYGSLTASDLDQDLGFEEVPRHRHAQAFPGVEMLG